MRRRLHSSDVYRYETLVFDLTLIKERFPNQVELQVIGKSVEERAIYALKIGSGDQVILCHGAHHAREWMTSWLIADFIKRLLESEQEPWLTIRENWLSELTFWFIPMINPDGVTLVQKGADTFSNSAELLKWNQGSPDFTSWKANSRGVDLNRQYPTDWETIQKDPGEPSPSHFKGYQPLSEPEVQALVQFVKQHKIDCAVAYHSSGEEIFWRYNLPDKLANKHRPLAELLAKVTSYELIEPKGTPSGGGFTDWFLTEYQRPSFTMEIAPSIGPRPVPNLLYERVFTKNEPVLYTIGSYLIKKAQKIR